MCDRPLRCTLPRSPCSQHKHQSSSHFYCLSAHSTNLCALLCNTWLSAFTSFLVGTSRAVRVLCAQPGNHTYRTALARPYADASVRSMCVNSQVDGTRHLQYLLLAGRALVAAFSSPQRTLTDVERPALSLPIKCRIATAGMSCNHETNQCATL